MHFLIIVVMSCCISVSCEKGYMKPEVGSMEDLLGTYSVNVREDAVWGGTSGTLYDSGTIEITKISKNRVRIRGLISTTGEIIDGELYLDSETNSDSYGHLTTTYYSTQFGAGILTIWAKVSGELASNGVLYPYNSHCYFECRKKK